jgi:hypothetical protein
MGQLIDLTGQRFGRLTVIKKHGINKHRQVQWLCQCDCGNLCTPLGMCLRKNNTRSCGCLAKKSIALVNYKHGMAKTPIYRIWRSMMQRCYDINSHSYKNYGGRGIFVCKSWHDFEKFYEDMRDRPKGKSLERLNNNVLYAPENVIWANNIQQANNRRSNVILEYQGRKQTMQQWSDEVGLKIQTVWARLKRGWTVERALTEKVK